jgi:hypothetical protein
MGIRQVTGFEGLDWHHGIRGYVDCRAPTLFERQPGDGER